MARRGKARNAILAAARSEFAEHGYAGGRVARIATRAGVNKQLIFYYFGSKAGLHAAVAPADQRDESTAGAPTGHPPPERLRTALASIFTQLDAHPELALLLADPQAGPDAAAAAQSYTLRRVRELAAVFSEGQGMGYFRDDLDPELTARQALALVGGFFALRHLAAGSAALRRQWSGGAADLLLRAAAW